jgi:hypothetical protein
LGSFSHMAACKSSSKNTRKLNLIPVLNKPSPRAHTKSELAVLGEVVLQWIRPKLPRETYVWIQTLLNECWLDDPSVGLHLNKLLKDLKAYFVGVLEKIFE